MQVFVKSLSSKTWLFNMESNQKVNQLKQSLQDKEGIDSNLMRLIFEGHNLENDNTLEDAGISDLSTIELVLSLKGGKKKKKRKQYTTAKKNKHRHKNISLRTLTYYSINNEQEKVIRNRSLCPVKNCGPGVRMAKHKDRVHCGKCGKTFRIDQQYNQET